jgi:hypothetical protein
MSELASDGRMAAVLDQIRQDPSLVDRLPTMEGTIVRAALEGETVYEIAQTHAVTEGAIWEVLTRVAHVAIGHDVQSIESGGLGSDPSPGEESANRLE